MNTRLFRETKSVFLDPVFPDPAEAKSRFLFNRFLGVFRQTKMLDLPNDVERNVLCETSSAANAGTRTAESVIWTS
jgi:hypothetical protein